MKRGDVVTVALSGDYGKPRPAVIVQSDLANTTGSVLVCSITSDLHDALFYRVALEHGERTGLYRASQVMVDKIAAVSRTKVGNVIGSLDENELGELDAALAVMVGLAGD